MSLLTLLLLQPEIYERLPESWRVRLHKRALRQVTKAIAESGAAFRKATDSLRLLSEAYGLPVTTLTLTNDPAVRVP
mgnify:CR=1 FL=1